LRAASVGGLFHMELRRTAGHKSSRRPLKTGWRTLPSADFARYSISANKVGSTQMPALRRRFMAAPQLADEGYRVI
jgi:hypothetical protein